MLVPQLHPDSDIEIVELGDATSIYIKTFDCRTKEINNFLLEDALKQTKQGVNKTYLWVSRDKKELIGYITICNDAINLDGSHKEQLKKIGIAYKSLPAIKIGRMGVSHLYQRKQIGTRMIAFAINIALQVHGMSACRFITLDAKNEESQLEEQKPVHFYQKLGFEKLNTKKKNNATIPMCKDLYQIICERQNSKLH